MKFLITPNYAAPYDQRMVDGLAHGFVVSGHEALALPAPPSATDLRKICLDQSFDVVIQVNRTRHPDVPLPAGVRHISWYQDVFPETMKGFAEFFQPEDILYALGDPVVLGLVAPLPCFTGTLLSGVDASTFEFKTRQSQDIDFSLCGFIPPPLPEHRTLWRFLRPGNVRLGASDIMSATVRERYQVLCGNLDIHALAEEIRANIEAHRRPILSESMRLRLRPLRNAYRGIFAARQDPDALTAFERSISYFTREYPRLLDRVALIDTILQISHALELYGPGWQTHRTFRPYAKGSVDTLEELLTIYARSRINLANNTHGLGLHSRTLECMAIGGFIFTHESPHDNKPGGMLTSFEPGTHYGAFTPDTLVDQAARWLRDESGRRHAGELAAQVVRQQHCWYHRAQQIVEDLKR
jgi:hypothetical protein